MFNHIKFLILTLICFSASAFALNEPQHGTYLGFFTGPVYLQNIDSVEIPQITGLTTGTTNATMQNKLGWGIGIQFGYRIVDRFRVEGQYIGSFNKPRRVIFSGGQIKIPNAEWGIDGYTDTAYGLFVNAFYDILLKDMGTYRTSAPYIGIGYGYVSLTNQLKIYQNGVFTRSAYVGQPTTTAKQVILGWNVYPDDFTTFGIDYRYIKYDSVQNFTSGYASHSINLIMNFVVGKHERI